MGTTNGKQSVLERHRPDSRGHVLGHKQLAVKSLTFSVSLNRGPPNLTVRGVLFINQQVTTNRGDKII